MRQFNIGPEIYHGPDSLEHLISIDEQRIFIVTDQVMVKIGTIQKIIDLLNKTGKEIVVFSDVEPDPSLDTVKKGLSLFTKEKPDCLLAVGGGSPIDTAKAILLLSTKLQKQFVDECFIRKPKFIAIPTTSGTGSEVTSYSVVSDKQRGIKIPLNDKLMLPDVAILDENLTKTVPSVVTADTGMDVLTHALEAYVSNESTEMTDMYAERAVKLVFKYLLRAYKFGDDLEARGKVHLASCMAGVAFTNASLGINHSLAHVLGGKFHLPHGRSNAVLLPYIIAFNSGKMDRTIYTSKAAKRYAAISEMLGFSFSTIEEGVDCLISEITKINKKMGIPHCIESCKISSLEFEAALDEMTSGALQDICTPGNPKKVTKEDLENILKISYVGQ